MVECFVDGTAYVELGVKHAFVGIVDDGVVVSLGGGCSLWTVRSWIWPIGPWCGALKCIDIGFVDEACISEVG